MKRTKGEPRNTKSQNPSWVRASISFPVEIYQNLENLAKQKKVSLAWVVRDAAEKYVADEKPQSRKKWRESRQDG